jgi:adenine-specific DNA-methyltransferase
MGEFESKLNALIKTDARFLDQDGEVLRASVVDAAYKGDSALVELLLGFDEAKIKFFSDVKGVLAFKTADFVAYIEDKNFLNDSYTRFKNKIGLTIDGKFFGERGEVALTWPFKDCVLEGGMTKEDQKRKEIFFNEILAQDEIDKLFTPKVLTNWKRYTAKGEEKINKLKRDESGLIKENLVIKGNNLLALHTLKQQFAEKVKLIYIDPPFNTGTDSFLYNDGFSHSTWLTFMKNRLEIAKQLLTRDGNVFIHIDVNESHYLKILCDEVFGRENFVEEITWAYGSASGGRAAGAKPVNIHDYILHYAREYSSRKQNKIHTPYTDKYVEDWFKYTDKDGRRYRRRMRERNEKGEVVWEKQYLDESKGVPLTTVWTDIRQVYADPRAYKENQREHTELMDGFSTQKPERLMQRILEMATDPGDIVLDYHLGSGTTAAVAHKMGRQYIGTEQLHYEHNGSVPRLQKVIKGDTAGISKEVGWKGGGDFVYAELMRYNELFIGDIETAKDTNALLKIWQRMKEEAFFKFSVEMQAFENSIDTFKTLPLDKQKKILCGVLDKNQLYVNLSEIDDAEFKIAKADQQATKEFYDGR